MNLKSLVALVFLVLMTSSAWSIDESLVFNKNGDQIDSVILDKFYENKICDNELKNQFWTLKMVKTDRGTLPASYTFPGKYRLRYSRFGCELGKLGALVIAPGRGEASIDYFETAMDFIDLGYSPVYVVDHRGQGFSPRLIPSTPEAPMNHHKGHVGAYIDYVTDMKTFVEDVESDLKSNFGRTDEPMFYTSNSMGGAIGVGYFQMMGQNNPFKAASLHGSQVIVNYISFLKQGLFPDLKFNSKALLRGYIKIANEKQGDRVHFITSLRCFIGQCEDYGAKPGEYVEIPFKHDDEAMMTHSESRYYLSKHFRKFDRDKWESIVPGHYQAEESWHGIYVGGATNQWTRETSGFNSDMVKIENLAKMTKMPLRLVTGSLDLRAYREYTVVENHWRKAKGKPEIDLYHHDKMCDDLNLTARNQQVLNGESVRDICDHVVLGEGYHELYKESDHWRNQSIQKAHEHFQNSL